MKYLLYAVRDEKAGIYLSPFTQQNDAVAVRFFSDACQNAESNIHAHPEDYSLYRIGEFSNDDGVVTAFKCVQLSHATNFVVAK